MIDTGAIRSKVLELAIQGKLSEQLLEDGNAEELYVLIQEEKQKLIKEGKIKKEKLLADITEEEIPFDIPSNWKWVRLGDCVSILGDGLHGTPKYSTNGEYYFINGNNLKDGKIEIKSDTKCVDFEEYEKYKKTLNDSTVLVSINGTIGNVAFYSEEKVILGKSACYFNMLDKAWKKYIYWIIKTDYFIKYATTKATGVTIKNVSLAAMKLFLIPLPPLEEQERITKKIEDIFNTLDWIDSLQNSYISDSEILKTKIIDAGIQGKLTIQLQEDGFAECINEEEIPDKDKSFDIPDNWRWIRLGWAMEIERGGSPRPIKAYMTEEENGINWIKIGDVEKDGKYIYSTKEKIKPEGEKKSRKVYPGDFLLTNSMSFGRPYISKIEGCIHDGWLLLRNSKGIFDLDYLYWLLSSKYAYNQFVQKASGATVDNLNKDKVASAIIPLPPLAEQRRIANRIEELIQLL